MDLLQVWQQAEIFPSASCRTDLKSRWCIWKCIPTMNTFSLAAWNIIRSRICWYQTTSEQEMRKKQRTFGKKEKMLTWAQHWTMLGDRYKKMAQNHCFKLITISRSNFSMYLQILKCQSLEKLSVEQDIPQIKSIFLATSDERSKLARINVVV